MKYDSLSRRHFLQGLGKFALALPTLPSLLPKAAFAQAMDTPPLRFVGMRSWYGFTPNNWYNPIDQSGNLQNVAPGVFAAPMSAFGQVNPILGNRFNSVKDKTSLLLGLDISDQNFGDHNRCVFLTGASAANGSDSESGGPSNDNPYSMDVALERSAQFYSSLPQVKTLRLSPSLNPTNRSFSYEKVNGNIVRLPGQSDAQALFNLYFGNNGGGGGGGLNQNQKKSLVIDKVLPDFNRLIASNKMSSEDKSRVQNYADLIRDLQTRLDTQQTQSCTDPTLNNDRTAMSKAYSNHIDISVAALACGITKSVCMEIRHFEDNPNYNGSSFHDATHGEGAGSDSANLGYNSWIADRVAEMVLKLDAIQEPDGSTLLDNTITFWGNELSSRQSWHRLENMPVFIAGGNNHGKIRNGHIIDYRQRPFRYYANRGDFPSIGRPYPELLISLMMAYGLTPADWELNGTQGFGSYRHGTYGKNEYGQFFANKRAPLPYFYLGG